MLTFQFNGAEGEMLTDALLTSGMVNQQVLLQFDTFWEDLLKTVVFVAGSVCRTVEIDLENIHKTGTKVVIPPEVLIGGQRLFVGVYGHDSTNSDVTPTVMVKGPRIAFGADPTEYP